MSISVVGRNGTYRNPFPHLILSTKERNPKPPVQGRLGPKEAPCSEADMGTGTCHALQRILGADPQHALLPSIEGLLVRIDTVRPYVVGGSSP